MRNQTPVENIDRYPDLLGCFRGSSNRRQREEYKRFLYRAIKTQLTQRQKTIVMMRYFQHMSAVEIAEELHINKSTVHKILNRALDRLTDLAKFYFEIK